jgi:hypothetical protein
MSDKIAFSVKLGVLVMGEIQAVYGTKTQRHGGTERLYPYSREVPFVFSFSVSLRLCG